MDETKDLVEKERIIRAFWVPNDKWAMEKIMELSVYHLTKELEREEVEGEEEEEKYDKVFYAWLAKMEQCYGKIAVWKEEIPDIVKLGEFYQSDYRKFCEEKKNRQKRKRCTAERSNIQTLFSFTVIAIYVVLWYLFGLNMVVIGVGWLSLMVTLFYDKIVKMIWQKKRKWRIKCDKLRSACEEKYYEI